MLWGKDKEFNIVLDSCIPPGDISLRMALRSELNRLLAKRPASRSDERLSGVVLVDPFTIENGLLTQTLKQRRELISARDRKFIEIVYGRTAD